MWTHSKKKGIFRIAAYLSIAYGESLDTVGGERKAENSPCGAENHRLALVARGASFLY